MNNYLTLTGDLLEDPSFNIITDEHQTTVNDAKLIGYENLMVWDIGDNQIVVYPNPELTGDVEGADGTEKIIKLVGKHLNNINNLKNLGIPTCGASDMYIEKNDILLPASLSPSSEGLKDRGIYILSDTNSIFPRTWEGGLFNDTVDVNSTSVWKPIVENLFYDFVKLKKSVTSPKSIDLLIVQPTLAVCPATETNIISKYEVRYIGLELFNVNVNSSGFIPKSKEITNDIIQQVGQAILTLADLEKVNVTDPFKLARDLHSRYLAKRKFKLVDFEDIPDFEEVLNELTINSKLPEFIPRDFDNIRTEHFIDQISSIERILGPDDFKVYTLNDRLIYLFGDVHKPTEVTGGKLRSVPLREYFDYFFHNSPVTCDLFLEAYVFLNVPNNPQYREYEQRLLEPSANRDELGIIVEKYGRCLGKNKHGCHKFGNVRFHNVDFRRIANPDYNLSEIRLMLDDILVTDYDALNNYIGTIPIYSQVFASLLIGDMEMAAESFRIIYQDIPQLSAAYETHTFMEKSGYDRMFKQFENLPKQGQLTDYFIKRMDTLVASSIPEDEDQASKLRLVEDFNFQFELLFMDAYAIARLLKSVFLYGKNISMMYTGKTHTSVYADILTQIYGATPVVNIESSNQFVDISMINQDQLRTELLNAIFIE